jgi:glycosyltransferase involved in cell wall biosynthesis
MDKRLAVPSVSVGMPVFNGEQFIRYALDSLLEQSFSDFELIISDNASIDGTESICREYAARDARIRYVRQPTPLGAWPNFEFVLSEARGKYFIWAACDDTRSSDFIELNFRFLSENPEYVASTCPNRFEGQNSDAKNFVNFSLDGEVFERFIQFFNHCWLSHGIFYSLIRTDILRNCNVVGKTFLASDWAIDLYLASKGKINRTKDGYAIFGVQGASSASDVFKTSRNDGIELLLPFYRLARYVTDLTTSFPLGQRVRIILILLKLNLIAALHPLHTVLYSTLRALRRNK